MCGIFGVIRKTGSIVGEKRYKHLVRNLGIASQIRGTDATGISWNWRGILQTHKEPTAAASFPFIKLIPNETAVVMGHTRLTTQGSELINRNNHPFNGRAGKTGYAFAHNGTLWNDLRLKKDYKLPKSKIETDSYVVGQLLDRYGELSVVNMKKMAESLEGSFMLTFLEEMTNNMWFVKGDNPIYMVEFGELGIIAYASTQAILEEALAQDMMLSLYYQAGLDNIDHARVRKHTFIEGDIIKYDYKKDAFEKGEFDYYMGEAYFSSKWKDYNWRWYDNEDYGDGEWVQDADGTYRFIKNGTQTKNEVVTIPSERKEVAEPMQKWFWTEKSEATGEILIVHEQQDDGTYYITADEGEVILDFPCQDAINDWLGVFHSNGLETAIGVHGLVIRTYEEMESAKDLMEAREEEALATTG